MLDLLEVIEPNTIDSVVTDPPYELNFMNKGWDRSGIAFQKDTWDKCYQALKPGGYLLAFGGSRTFHRIAVAIEDAGFEIRDVIMWVYGSGFPKSHDISKALDKMMGAERTKKIEKVRNPKATGNGHDGTKGATRPFIEKALKENGGLYEIDDDTPISDEAKQWQGWGTALKPAYEPVIVARKPLKGTVAQNVMQYGVGGINIDECRVATDETINSVEHKEKNKGVVLSNNGLKDFTYNQHDLGRFPANFIHNGSDEVTSRFPSTEAGGSLTKEYQDNAPLYGDYGMKPTFDSYGDSGNASRFFYTAKASKKDRDEGLGKKEFDSVEIILYNISKGDDIVWKDTLKTQEVQKVKQSEDMVISLKKAIEEYGTQNNVDIDLNTILYGKKHLEQYLMDTKYTTKMEINLTTIQQTLNLLRHFTTKEFTAVVNSKQTVGGNNVINATNGNTLDIIINEKTEYQVLANSVQLKLQLVIKEKESRNVHPTIKPCELMQYLVRLVTPKNGTVLDPFMGSGSTGKATMFENRERKANYKFIGIDLDLDNQYCEIANARIDYALNKFEYDEQEIREQDKAKGQMNIFDFMGEDND